MKVGDLVKGRARRARVMILSPGAPNGIGIVTKRIAREIAYVYWGTGKPKPINIRLLEKVR
jgi:hypothetical protein